ncbi:MAG: hypothetical protein AAFO94_09225, partial [Bacteroidota bacterium]
MDTIQLFDPPAFDVGLTSNDPSCSGGDGSILLSASGGSGNFDYSIDNGLNYQSSNSFTNLDGGVYNILVRDATGCIKLVTDTLESPAPFAVTVDDVAADCSDNLGQLTATVIGGTGPFTFSWSDGQNESTAIDLPQGSYTISVTDPTGCMNVATAMVNDPGADFNLTVSAVSPDCFGDGGRIDISTSNTAQDYSYSIDGGNSFSNGSSFVNLPKGEYQIVVRDEGGCTVQQTASISEPDSLYLTIDEVQGISCFGDTDGNIVVSPVGGTPGFSFALNDGPFGVDSEFSNLPFGKYVIKVADGQDCLFETDTIFLPGADPVDVVLLENASASCDFANGRASVALSGGSFALPYQFFWNGATVDEGPSRNDLTAGTYKVVGVDGKGCSDSLEIEIVARGLIELNTPEVINSACGASNGSILFETSGENEIAVFTWSHADSLDGAFAEELSAGTYDVTVSSGVGCTDTASVVVSDIGGPEVSLSEKMDDACGKNIGLLVLEVQGGNGDYSFNWSDSSIGNTAKAGNLSVGSYTVTVEDESACQTIATFAVEETPALMLTLADKTDPQCDNPVGSITGRVVGGTAPYRYSWNDAALGEALTADKLPGGTYKLYVTDANDCRDSLEVVLNEPVSITVELGAADTAACAGNNIMLTSRASLAGQEGLTYSWKDAAGLEIATSDSLTVSQSGAYELEVSNGSCTVSDVINVNISDDIMSANFLMASEAVQGDTLVFVENSFPVPDQLQWTISDPNATWIKDTLNQSWYQFPNAGTYEVTMEAWSGNCYDAISKTITIYENADSLGQVQAIGFSEILDFKIFPNPTTGQFTVEVELSRAQDIQLRVYDVNSVLQT